ncbi:MAG: polysaccharide pyruvyl transferase family protein [Elusimicrobiaceae bacterium]|nr:polysaccharide pyruvyl transferase family protein [Elusimicrobiaceae bacterium]
MKPSANTFKTIGLYGIYGLYNFGCEAIVRGTYQMLKSVYPHSRIVYFSYHYEYDKEVLADLEIEVVQIRTRQSLPLKCVNKFLQIIGCEKRIFSFDYKKMINSVDCFFSIGGDIYTIAQRLLQKKRYPYYNSLVDFCERCFALGKDVYVYGASVGPFGEYPKAVQYYRHHLAKYQKIICREEKSVQYLRALGLTNTAFMPDPAFIVKGPATATQEKKYIGLNLSPLSLQELYGRSARQQIKPLAEMVEKLCESFSQDILLLPHVLAKNPLDNDLHFMTLLKDTVDEKYRGRLKIANYHKGFLGIKQEMYQCEIVIAARMHCAVNALTENIPALFLSYSQKSRGMAQYVYGHEKWVLPLQQAPLELPALAREMLGQKESVAAFLKERNRQIELDYRKGCEEMLK